MRSSSCGEPTISGRVALARITAEPMSAETCIAAVMDPQAGGIGCFVGAVRADDGGRQVTALCYEAHPTAAAKLEEICRELATGAVIAVAAEHRTGRLEVGDLAVVVAVSAPHRAEALAATGKLIDAIKARVPIWKEQHYSDGTSDWVGCDDGHQP